MVRPPSPLVEDSHVIADPECRVYAIHLHYARKAVFGTPTLDSGAGRQQVQELPAAALCVAGLSAARQQWALEMRQQGMSLPQIAKQLGVGYGTVVRASGWVGTRLTQ